MQIIPYKDKNINLVEFIYPKPKEKAHSNIDSLIKNIELKDNFKFGEYGDIRTNLLESLIRRNSDLLNIGISGKLGKNKQWDYFLGGEKNDYGLNISRSF